MKSINVHRKYTFCEFGLFRCCLCYKLLRLHTGCLRILMRQGLDRDGPNVKVDEYPDVIPGRIPNVLSGCPV